MNKKYFVEFYNEKTDTYLHYGTIDAENRKEVLEIILQDRDVDFDSFTDILMREWETE